MKEIKQWRSEMGIMEGDRSAVGLSEFLRRVKMGEQLLLLKRKLTKRGQRGAPY